MNCCKQLLRKCRFPVSYQSIHYKSINYQSINYQSINYQSINYVRRQSGDPAYFPCP